MVRSYEKDRFEVFQVHSRHGRRLLINADGHGQSVWIGEIAGCLLILDEWRCMGDKDGSLRVLDPDTLESKAHIYLDLDAAGPMGLDHADRFVLCESRAGTTTWRAWSLPEWSPAGEITPPDRALVRGLKEALRCMRDLPRATDGNPKAGDKSTTSICHRR